ncbi:MAG: hypothetical protein AAF267_22880 [Deinococcota bacterium]
MDNNSNLYRSIAFAVIFFAFGLLMIFAPDLMDGAVASGRRSGIRQLLILVWGIPGGIVLLLLGGFSVYSAIQLTNK